MKLTAYALFASLILTGCGVSPSNLGQENSQDSNSIEVHETGSECKSMGAIAQTAEGEELECRIYSGKVFRWTLLAKTSVLAEQTFESEKIEVCQLKNFVNYDPNFFTGGDLGYPAVGEMPSLGTVNVAVVPVDFSDVPGVEDPIWLEEQMQRVDSWVEQYSHGKMKYEWQFSPEWFRAPKPVDMYDTAKTIIQSDGSSATSGADGQTREQMVAQLFEAAESAYNFSDSEFVFFVFPKEVKGKVEFGPDGRDVPVKTKKGSYRLGFHTIAGYHSSVGEPWHQWLHEVLHSHGLIGHAPGNEYPYNIMAWDGGPGQSLTAWDTFILQWFQPSQVACFDRKKLEPQTFEIMSIDNPGDGLKTAMVRLSENEIIVIESRRKASFTGGFPDGFYGLQAYYVNTKHDGQRYDFALDRETEMKYFAYYLLVDSMDHETGSPSVSGSPSNLNVVAYAGDSFTYKGVKIEFLETGDFDKLRVSKVEK